MIISLLSISQTLGEIAQAGAEGHPRPPCISARRDIEQGCHSPNPEHHRQIAHLMNKMGDFDDVAVFECDLKKNRSVETA